MAWALETDLLFPSRLQARLNSKIIRQILLHYRWPFWQISRRVPIASMPGINAEVLAVIVWVAVRLAAAALVISARYVGAIRIADRTIAPCVAVGLPYAGRSR